MSESVALTLHSDLQEIGKAQQTLAAFCASRGIDEEVVSEMELAIEEILTNVMNHAYSGAEGGEIRVRIGLDQGQLVAEVEDHGEEFDPLAQETPDLDLPIEDRPIGGLGIHLVVNIMDAVEYKREGGVNRLTVKKRVGTG